MPFLCCFGEVASGCEWGGGVGPSGDLFVVIRFTNELRRKLPGQKKTTGTQMEDHAWQEVKSYYLAEAASQQQEG